MAFAPQRKASSRQQLAFAQRGRHQARRELGERNIARTIRPFNCQHCIERGGDGYELGGRIELAERAAERAAVARLAMTDLQHGLVQQRTALADAAIELDIPLASHGTDNESLAFLLDVGKGGDAIQVDNVLRRGEPHVEQRHERLAAGEQPRVLQLAEEAHHLGQSLRVVIGEARRLHSGRMPASRMTSRKRATSAFMIAAISGADLGNMSMPAALMRCAKSGMAMTLRRSPSSRATMSGGVPVRAIRP